MNPDKRKLTQILKNLERDYNDGLISEEKYIYLSNQYKHKIKTIDVSNRIRVMQGREDVSSPQTRRYDSSANREEEELLVRKFINNPNNYTHSNTVKKDKGSSSWVTVLAVIILLVAFGAGITFGMSNIGFNNDVTHLISGGAKINDTAFPEVTMNKSVVKYTKSYSNYSSSKYLNYSSSGSSSSSSSGSGGSGSGGSGSGGSGSGGSTISE